MDVSNLVDCEEKESVMIKKKVLNPKRVRKINGGFSFIPHRFLTDGFLALLNPHELLLYFFLVLAGDRNGISFYNYDKICTLLQMNLERYIMARVELIRKVLIAFDGTLFQVLDLPQKCPDPRKRENRSPVEQLIQQTIKGV